MEEPIKGAPAPPANVTLRSLFSHPAAHPIVLDLIVFNKYGLEWMEWEPETVQAALQKDFGNVSDLALSKLMAMRTLHVSGAFWREWEVFGWCCMALNGIFPDFQVMQVPSVEQCAIAVDIANRTRSDVSWSEEVRIYLSTVHVHQGIEVAQPPLEDLADVDIGAFPTDVPLQEIHKRWPEVRRTLVAPTGSTHLDEQLRRMLDVYEALEMSHARLRDQLPLVSNG